MMKQAGSCWDCVKKLQFSVAKQCSDIPIVSYVKLILGYAFLMGAHIKTGPNSLPIWEKTLSTSKP